ncbi:bifunctional demethylmenaquinone methyltransferase/2-methoxy-6-polyprenyl-1,4-benzoquinol methylase UbiE [Neosynechococcus sphagnicola]|uniref:bifunctional demethylmenaquinone methyltransferase/2-methoxy-6-polyprenyl-1,4-benzoquinol methylase UbiE n=1 Tax=Neosynechococcus sphagnicola TaxID=1501145 RepID=UPI000A5A34ED|nr:bifunctional demethylmenaquinone methyltransferase/2-methoxy-6-polyprenyl-1,4-benzoquinol methylase UbiE [Neosynechococcus sphagnicola]
MLTIDPTAASIQTLFNRIAPVYDDLNQWLSLGQHKIWKQMAVNWARPHPGAVVLDLCCGSGDLAQLLAQAVGDQGQVIGADFSSAQLAIARQRYLVLPGRSPITWTEADALALPFADHTFDAATMGYGLRNVTDIPRSLRELYRVLKPGARAAILDLHRPSNPMVSAFQQWYLAMVVVPMAEHWHLSEEYAYIAPSLEKFPTGTEQLHLAKQAGFTPAVHYPIAGGTMGVLVITKPASGVAQPSGDI